MGRVALFSYGAGYSPCSQDASRGPVRLDWSRGVQPQVSDRLPSVSLDTLPSPAPSVLAAMGHGSLVFVPREAAGRVGAPLLCLEPRPWIKGLAAVNCS